MSAVYQPPRVRDDGACAVCLKVRPEAAVKAGDPFCSTACTRADYSGTSAPPAAPPLEVAAVPGAAAAASNGSAIWTRETVTAAIQQWAAEHDGLPPKSSDWLKSPGSGWPNMSTVIRLFGKWRAAIEAAGLDANYWAKRGARQGRATSAGVELQPVSVVAAAEAPPEPRPRKKRTTEAVTDPGTPLTRFLATRISRADLEESVAGYQSAIRELEQEMGLVLRALELKTEAA